MNYLHILDRRKAFHLLRLRAGKQTATEQRKSATAPIISACYEDGTLQPLHPSHSLGRENLVDQSTRSLTNVHALIIAVSCCQKHTLNQDFMEKKSLSLGT